MSVSPGATCAPSSKRILAMRSVTAGVTVTDSVSFARAALEGVKVAVVPGAAFGADGCVRLCFAAAMAQIDEGLDRLEQLLS
jgi:aspartate aminotransferase